MLFIFSNKEHNFWVCVFDWSAAWTWLRSTERLENSEQLWWLSFQNNSIQIWFIILSKILFLLIHKTISSVTIDIEINFFSYIRDGFICSWILFTSFIIKQNKHGFFKPQLIKTKKKGNKVFSRKEKNKYLKKLQTKHCCLCIKHRIYQIKSRISKKENTYIRK